MSLIDGLVGAILVATVLSSMWVFLIPMITTVLLSSVVGLSLFGIVRNFPAASVLFRRAQRTCY